MIFLIQRVLLAISLLCVYASAAPQQAPVKIFTVSIPTGTCAASAGPATGPAHCPRCSGTVVTYTSTNSLGSSFTTSSTLYPTSTGGSVVVYTTTNSLGSSIITSSTSFPAPSSPVVFTTTNSLGSTTTSTSLAPISTTPVTTTTGTSSIIVTTTNSLGSSTTYTSATTFTSTYTPAPSPDLCPSYAGKNYTDSDGITYAISCNVDYPGNDITTITTNSQAECALACSNYGASCVACSFGARTSGGQCYLKYAITGINRSDGGIGSCRRIDYNPPYFSTATTGTVISATISSTSSSIPLIGSTSLASYSSVTSLAATSSTATTPVGTNSAASSSASTPWLCNGVCTGTVTGPSVTSATSSSTSNPGVVTRSSTVYQTSVLTFTSCASTVASCPASATGVTTIISSTVITTISSSSSSSSSLSSSSSTASKASSTVSGSSTIPSGASYTPTCTNAQDNNTQYYDFAGSLYNIKCGLQIIGDNLLSVHADTFDTCIEYCDIVSGCAAVTYLDGAASNSANCYPYSDFQRYDTNSPSGVYSAVLQNAAYTSGSIDNRNLCLNANNGKSYNQSIYTDPMGFRWFIGCDQQYNGAAGGGDLLASQAPTLDGCLQYCATYKGCIAADYGPGANQKYNCFPKMSSSNIIYQQGTQYASLVT